MVKNTRTNKMNSMTMIKTEKILKTKMGYERKKLCSQKPPNRSHGGECVKDKNKETN